MNDDYLVTLREFWIRARSIQDAISVYQALDTPVDNRHLLSDLFKEQIYESLAGLDTSLADSYLQIGKDLMSERLSWAGTAHEIREILSRLLHTLAPDEEVKSQRWYRQDKNTPGPTQAQRARFIMEQYGAEERERQAVEEQIRTFEEQVGRTVRAIYNRASDAAHRTKDKDEVNRILRYFNTVAHDLLNIRS